MSLTTSNSSVAAPSTYTLSFNRSLNALAQPIPASPLSTDHILTLTFNAAYILTNVSTVPSYSSINASARTLTFSLSTTINNIVNSNIANPYASLTPLCIFLAFSNSSNPSQQIDTSSASLSFQSLGFSSSAFSYNLVPGNVSSASNLTLSVTPFVWDGTKMVLSLSMPTYWSRNMLNVTANQVVSSLTYCSPSCLLQSRGGFFVLEWTGLTLAGQAITVSIFNILSPATL